MDEEEPTGNGLDRFLVTMPTAWPIRVRKAVIDFGLLCGGIVAVTMLPVRINRGDGWWFVLFAVGTIAGVGLFLAIAQRVALASPLSFGQAAGRLMRLGLRRLGLPLIGLVFFVVWTAIYISVWLVHPDEAFVGLARAPRIADFFYYAVSAALLATPQDIVASSRGARAATLIEMLTGFAVLATYVSSFVNWRSTPEPAGTARRASGDEPGDERA